MKTLPELYFEKHIICTISKRDCSPEERAALFYEFYKHGATYYDDFCEALFLLSTGEEKGSLYFTPAGKPYINHKPIHIHDFKMTSGEELPVFQGDLYDQLIYCKQRIIDRSLFCTPPSVALFSS